jgi:hypothetical protein
LMQHDKQVFRGRATKKKVVFWGISHGCVGFAIRGQYDWLCTI